MTTQPTPQSSPIKIDPKAIQATVIRYVVPTLVGVLVSLAAKAGFSLSPAQTFGIVAPAVGTVYSTVAHYLEVKVPALSRLLGATKPATLTK